MTTTLQEHPLDTCGWKIVHPNVVRLDYVQDDSPDNWYQDQGTHKWKVYYYYCICHHGEHHLWTYSDVITDGSAISSDGFTHEQILSQEHCDAAPYN